MNNKILRLPEVMKIIGLRRSTIYRKISEGSFPRPIPLGERAVGWIESDIQEWIDKKIKSLRN